MKIPDFPLDQLADAGAVKRHLDSLEAQNKVQWAADLPEIIQDIGMMVKEAKDADLSLKFAKFLTDYVGWGTAAKKVDNPQSNRPVFHISINRTGSTMKVTSVDPDTDQVTDVFTMDALDPTPLMLQTLSVNADLGALDA